MFFSPPRLAPTPAGAFANWSRTEFATPECMIAPETPEDLALALQGPAPVRAVGAGHSFSPIVASLGTIVSLHNLQGLISVDKVAQTAWLRAGTIIRDASLLLADHDLAFRNVGDIDVQSIAGAIATATHGTGAELPSLSAEVLALKMVTADGEEITLDEGDPRLAAARVSLGALGVISAVKISLVPRYRLRRRVWAEPIEAILDQAETRWASYRNYEFMAIPFSGYGLNICHDVTKNRATPHAPADDDASVMLALRVQQLLRRTPRLRRGVAARWLRKYPPLDIIGESWKLLANDRHVPFTEMEYHLPVPGALDVFKDVLARIERDRPDVFFPVEVRKTAGDSAWLSPFQGSPRVSVSVHAYYNAPNDWFRTLAEPVFREARGRPHWGKVHSLEAKDLADLYPDFEKFTTLRQQMDPKRRFVTPAMARLWGI